MSAADREALAAVRRRNAALFIVALGASFAESPVDRQRLSDWGVNMVAYDVDSAATALRRAVWFMDLSASTEAIVNSYSVATSSNIERTRDRDRDRDHENSDSRTYRCPYCKLGGLTEEMLWIHVSCCSAFFFIACASFISLCLSFLLFC